MADIPRIKRNIQKMIDQNAPEADIDAYVSSEGVTLDALQAPAAPVEQPAQTQDDQPWYKEAAQAADDIVRLTANGLTFGYADKLAGYMNGTGAEAERQRSEEASGRAGLAGNVAEIAGGIAGGGALLKGAGAVAKGVGAVSPTVAKFSNAAANLAARPGAVGLGARTAGAAGAGAALGALDATGHDRDVAEGATYGAMFGAGGNLVGEGLSKVAGKAAGLFNKKPTVASKEELEAAANAAYKAADDAGVILKPQTVQRLSKEIKDDLAEFGYKPRLQPRVKDLLDEIDATAGQNVTLKGMDQIRKVAGLMGKSNEPAEREIARQIIKKIDKHLETLNPGDILTGNKTQGVKSLQEARKLWSSVKKQDAIDEALARATRNADAVGSGGNVDNAIRQQFKAILNNPKKRRGFSKDEIVAMNLIVKGTPVQNSLRLLGKLSPQGGGLALYGQIMGGIASSGATAPLAAAGGAAKLIADRLTPANVDKLSRVVRSGGDASALAVQPNAVQQLLERNRGGLTMPLTVGGILTAN